MENFSCANGFYEIRIRSYRYGEQEAFTVLWFHTKNKSGYTQRCIAPYDETWFQISKLKGRIVIILAFLTLPILSLLFCVCYSALSCKACCKPTVKTKGVYAGWVSSSWLYQQKVSGQFIFGARDSHGGYYFPFVLFLQWHIVSMANFNHTLSTLSPGFCFERLNCSIEKSRKTVG